MEKSIYLHPRQQRCVTVGLNLRNGTPSRGTFARERAAFARGSIAGKSDVYSRKPQNTACLSEGERELASIGGGGRVRGNFLE